MLNKISDLLAIIIYCNGTTFPTKAVNGNVVVLIFLQPLNRAISRPSQYDAIDGHI